MINSCMWKRCTAWTMVDAPRLTTDGQVGLCERHWIMLGEWVERLEESGATLTYEDWATLLSHSLKEELILALHGG